MNPQVNSSSVPAPRKLAMDMAPRRVSSALGAPSPAAKPAAAMHSRVKTSHIIDLRASQKPAIAAEHPAAPIAQAANRTPAAPPKSTAHERHIAQFSDRFTQAKQYDRSPHINKFADKFGNPNLAALTSTATTKAIAPHAEPVEHHLQATHAAPSVPTAAPAQELPNHAVTHHEAMTRLINQAPVQAQAPATPAAKPAWRPHLSLSPHAGRIAATATAVVIMGGYIWLQNYPKLAMQAAGSKAGLSASLPGYVPSSYNLSGTDTAPGLVTLNFKSPSASEVLKIAQHRTSWDSSSLLDNFVAKNTDDYATVQGQGLTIYLFNNNQAAWVNHGIWYSIEGASRLSREQILKIAYSL